MNKQAVQASIDIGKEKTQYFEKIAFGCGGTIALVVSFVGAHSGRLQPPWLLRTSLVTLVFAMATAMFRNWKFQFYSFATWMRQNLEAKQEKGRCERNLMATGPVLSVEDGKPINATEWMAGFERDDQALTDQIAKCIKLETSAFNYTRIAEYVALVLAICGISLLIAVAWRNF
jgi:hypothetical protein